MKDAILTPTNRISHLRVNDTPFFLTKKDYHTFLQFTPDVNDVREYLGEDDMVDLLNFSRNPHEVRLHLAKAKGLFKDKVLRAHEKPDGSVHYK